MNLIQPILSSFPQQAWGAIGGTLNEPPERARQGLFDALPMIFAGLIAKGSTMTGASGLLSMLRSNPVDVDHLTRGTTAMTEPHVLREGDDIAHRVLGDSYASAANNIARHSGVGIGAAQSLLGLAAPLAFGGIARAAPANGFTAEGLMRFLQGQRDDVLSAAPQGLGVRNLFERTVEPAAARIVSEPVRRSSGIMTWIIGTAVAALLGLTLWLMMSQRTVTPPAIPAPPAITAPQLPSITLPGGIVLNAPVGSIGHSLAAYLASTDPVPHTFRFENLNFDTGNVVVTPESTATLDAIATTLKAYPNVLVRLDGHTDATGDRTANIALSRSRAEAVARALVQRGVDAQRITTTGFGPDRPIASNETEDGRAQNRRLELTVTQK